MLVKGNNYSSLYMFVSSVCVVFTGTFKKTDRIRTQYLEKEFTENEAFTSRVNGYEYENF